MPTEDTLPAKTDGLPHYSSVFDLPDHLRQQVNQWLIERKPYRWIAAQMQEREQISINHVAIWRYDTDHMAKLMGGDAANAQELREQLGDQVMFEALGLCSDLLIEFKKSRKRPRLENIKELNMILTAIGRIVNAGASRDRASNETYRAIKKLRGAFVAEIKRQLHDKPHIVRELLEATQRAANTLMAEEVDVGDDESDQTASTE